jgi:hypothetical protein
MISKHLALPSIGLSGSCNPLIKMPFQKFETHISINFRTFAAGTKTTHTMHDQSKTDRPHERGRTQSLTEVLEEMFGKIKEEK